MAITSFFSQVGKLRLKELWQYPELEPEAAIRPACPKRFHKVPDPEDKQTTSQAPHLRDTGIFGDRLIILKKIYFNAYACFSMHVCLCTTYMQYPWRPEDGARSLRDWS